MKMTIIAVEYATKRYRSNLINWGMLPFTITAADAAGLSVDDLIYIPGIRKTVQSGAEDVEAFIINSQGRRKIQLKLANLSAAEREIILAGSLINYYAG
jgi:aconitate hydratase